MKSISVSMLKLSFALFLFTACSEKNNDVESGSHIDNLTVTPSAKGWELYSWPEGNTWNFSFMVGTNRIKTLSEVTSSEGAVNLVRVKGVDSAKMVLNKFPAGETIMLIGQRWLQNAWGSQYGNLQLPPQNIIDALKSHSAQKSVTLEVAN